MFSFQQSNNQVPSNSWIKVHELNQEDNLEKHYEELCQKHHLSNKWLLIINPEDETLAQLSNNTSLDTSKILKIDPHKKPVNIDNIKSVLSQGNCSAVVLCNPNLQLEELKLLQTYAQLGQTQCVVLNKKQQIH